IGIVSARNRDIQSGPYDQFIQTDAAINQGNSGGPLFDMDGNVIGINTAIIARGGSSLGIGFAVPGNLAKPVIDQLAQYGETRRGWLGVGIQDVTEDIAASLGRTSTAGAMVIDVTESGPSEGALVEGDIILEFDGKPIPRMRDLPRVVAETAVGTKVPVKVLRNGEEITVEVTLGRLEAGEQLLADAEQKAQEQLAPSETDDEPVGPPPGLTDLVGFELAPIDADVRKEFGLSDATEGIVVTKVIEGSDAAEKGFIPGQLIVEVNQKKVASVDEVTAAVSEAKEAGRPAVLFKVADQTGTERFVAVRLN
uniref:PDZ domain-containing protein n=1 Tax=Devosia sp. TaxID=1871048 RepID=UPI0037C0F30B